MPDGGVPFDLDKGRFAISPRMAWSIIGAAVAIGGSIAAVHFRLGGLETGVAEIRQELADDRANAQTKQQAYINCLESERSNKGWKCPMAPQVTEAAKPRIETAKVKRVTAKRKEDTPSGWSLWAPATAAPKAK